jgi:hypothetical protein
MRELISDLFISLDGYAAAGENTPGYFGMLGPELEAWVGENVAEPQEMVMGRRTYDMLAQFANATEVASSCSPSCSGEMAASPPSRITRAARWSSSTAACSTGASSAWSTGRRR